MISLYAFGSNGSGQLGVGHDRDLDEPERCVFLNESEQNDVWESLSLSFGGNHTVLVNKTTGKAYGSGDNAAYQLGIDIDGTKQFVRLCCEDIYNDTHFVLTGSMWETSVLVDSHGFIYTTGSGEFGELGCTSTKDETEGGNPKRGFKRIQNVQLDSTAVKASNGLRHVLILCENGGVWGWGANRKQQVDHKSDDKTLWNPRKIMTGIRDIGCGKDFSVMISDDNKIIFQGNKQRFGDEMDQFIDCHNKSKDQVIELMAVGWSSIHFVVSNNDTQQIYAFGSNVHEQLYPFNVKSGKENPHIFTSISPGTEHYLAVESNTVKTWGWGEHGNCGLAYENGSQRVYGISLPDKSEYTKPEVFAGYASSWIKDSL